VEICFGSACPLGQCDNDGLFSDVPCSNVYTAPVGSTSMYCNATQSGGYCLTVRGTTLDDWAVQCTNGAAQITQCGAGCELEQAVANCL
jgi:hypothetical protein